MYAINFTSLGALYFLTIVSNMIAVFAVLLLGKKRASQEEKARLNTIFWGVTVMLIVNIATNTLLPLLGNLYALTNIGPLSGIFVVYALWLSIVRHRLFDMRWFIARSLTYILLLSVLASSFILGAFAVVGLFLHGNQTDINTLRWIYTLLAIGIAFIFSPLKKFFDRYTTKIFYRDSYEPQVFIDELNRALVSNVDTKILVNEATKIIDINLKSEFSSVTLRETSYAAQRSMGTKDLVLDIEDIEIVNTAFMRVNQRVILADTIRESDPKLYRVLDKHGIAALARLVTTLEYNTEGIGYLTVGAKKSGNAYSKKDADIIRIVAGELSIAVQNALRFEEIENFNVTLQQKVDDATKKLQRTNEKLKALDETKDEFISMASHQLRTPLTSVKGYVSMVLEGDAGPLTDMQRKLLEQSFASSQRMVYLIADLLNLSRLRTGKFIIEGKPTNLADVIETEVDQLKANAAGRDLTLTYDKPKDFPTLMMDETKIRQVIMNFADNAIYYTPAGGKIDIKLSQTADSIEFTVHDNGIGVPAAEQKHLFTKFYRAKNAQKARPDGTGLGLFMAKKVIIAQGGALIFRSIQGKGSTFGFTFSKNKLKIPDQIN